MVRVIFEHSLAQRYFIYVYGLVIYSFDCILGHARLSHLLFSRRYCYSRGVTYTGSLTLKFSCRKCITISKMHYLTVLLVKVIWIPKQHWSNGNYKIVIFYLNMPKSVPSRLIILLISKLWYFLGTTHAKLR